MFCCFVMDIFIFCEDGCGGDAGTAAVVVVWGGMGTGREWGRRWTGVALLDLAGWECFCVGEIHVMG